MDTCACMGASIGQAIGMEKAGIDKKLLAVIGDSTFMHSGITPLVNAVYNQSHITLVILDNMTTAMTGHQGHPATGVAASGKQTQAVDIEQLVRGLGVERVEVLDAFDVMSIRQALKKALGSNQLSVLIVRGICAPLRRFKKTSLAVDKRKCTRCMTCLRLACPAIQLNNGEVTIDRALCIGSDCGLCEQICPAGAISTAAGMEKQA
jgi:indolepyruvate ferredoxin oxidoreductase alpha subunit